MNLEGLLYTEIQEIRIAVEKHKEDRWKTLTKNIKKNVSFEDIKKFRKEFDMCRNRFKIEGRCNKVLEVIQKLDLDIQDEIK